MLKSHTICASLFFLILPLTNAQAQGDIAKSATPGALTITAAASDERVRFTAPASVVQIRLEVYASTGKKLFDNELRGGNVLDWHLQNGQAEPLPDDTYLCVVTVKNLSGRITQRIGSIRVEKSGASLQPAAASQMTAQQSDAIGPVEENAPLTILNDGETRTATVIAHNGTEGELIRGQGALSFRIGDFYRGKDTEQMRLTEEGNLGIGITNPQARLDVDGVIRASQGIIFPDGTTQYSAASKTLGAKSTMPGQESDQILGGKHKFHTESVTQNQIAKFLNGGGTLGDSVITETASGNIGIGTPAPGGVFDLQRNNPGDILQRLWNTGSGGAKLRYVAATGATSQVQLTDSQEWLMAIAGNNTAGMQFRVRDTTDPNTEAGLSAAARMTILRNGKVGIGSFSPAKKLVVGGGLGNSGILNDGIFVNLPGGAAITARDSITGVEVQVNAESSGIGTVGTFSNHPLNFRTNNIERMRIDTGGNVGIGTPGPLYPLTVFGAGGEKVDQGVAEFTNAATDTGVRIKNATTGGHTYTLFSSGTGSNIGVGNFNILDATANLTRVSITPSGTVNVPGNLYAKNLSGVRYSQAGDADMFDILHGNSAPVDSVTINAPAAGYIFVSAYVYATVLISGSYVLDFTLSSGGAFIVNSVSQMNHAALEDIDGAVPIHLSWVIPVHFAGSLQLSTSLYYNDFGYDESATVKTHNLTAIYLPAPVQY